MTSPARLIAKGRPEFRAAPFACLLRAAGVVRGRGMRRAPRNIFWFCTDAFFRRQLHWDRERLGPNRGYGWRKHLHTPRDDVGRKSPVPGIELKPSTFEDIVSRNMQLLNAKRLAQEAAAHEHGMLIVGEAGTEKELFARAVHRHAEK